MGDRDAGTGMSFISQVGGLRERGLRSMGRQRGAKGAGPKQKSPRILADPGAVSSCWSGKRDLNSRRQPWQGCTLPLSYSRSARETIYPHPSCRVNPKIQKKWIWPSLTQRRPLGRLRPKDHGAGASPIRFFPCPGMGVPGQGALRNRHVPWWVTQGVLAWGTNRRKPPALGAERP
ncbi:hypothetical protein MSL71_12850 [Desulfoluna butyratoxydans]|uniref:Uncharacterized protein n=1 Tax=Desulfoluna butyratoxydans TaxID=231438 RepID=A0A4U8YJR1_9BACT|nr:hypothetical protein MSL71_12850 [Desulfoluna butyratoxydans]